MSSHVLISPHQHSQARVCSSISLPSKRGPVVLNLFCATAPNKQIREWQPPRSDQHCPFQPQRHFISSLPSCQLLAPHVRSQRRWLWLRLQVQAASLNEPLPWLFSWGSGRPEEEGGRGAKSLGPGPPGGPGHDNTNWTVQKEFIPGCFTTSNARLFPQCFLETAIC